MNNFAVAALVSLLSVASIADAQSATPAHWTTPYNIVWTPDFNHGGSAMIAFHEMLLQTDGTTIRFLPAWPKDWNASFLLCAPHQTTVVGEVKNGKLVNYKVTPSERTKDVIIPDE